MEFMIHEGYYNSVTLISDNKLIESCVDDKRTIERNMQFVT